MAAMTKTTGLDASDADLIALVQADAARQPISKLGYFCKPFRAPAGPFEGHVIKVYRGLRDAAALERLKTCHDDYAQVLLASGVPMPATQMRLIDPGKGAVPVIVQEALDSDCLMRPLMQRASQADALGMMQAAGEVIARFWLAVEGDARRVGFHPSIRNFAIIEGQAVFFDTFPPLIHYSRAEMGQMLLTFSDTRLMRLAGPLMKTRVTAIQDEWYSPPETLVGLVGSACRLRPDDAPAFLDWGRGFAGSHMAPWEGEIRAGLTDPPQLSRLWTGMRKILGLQGEPNV